MGNKVAPGCPKEQLLSSFGYHLAAFQVLLQRMTGSALVAGRCVGIASRREVLKKREESEERGLRDGPDRRPADFPQSLFECFERPWQS